MTDTNAPLIASEVVPVTIAPANSLRCERCGAQGYVEVELLSKLKLGFCKHHFGEHEDVLVFKAKRIVDHRPHLEAVERGPR